MQLAPSPWDCLLFDWEFDPVVVLALAVTAVLYARGLIALRRRGTRAPGRRKVALFAGGWLTLVVALVSPVHEVSEQLFTVHMIEHELLMVVAAPLLVLARPMPVMLFGLTRGLRLRVAALLRHPLTRRIWAALSRPFDAWVIHGLAIWCWHIPLLFDATLRSEFVHGLQHVSFFWSGVLFWWAMLYGQRRATHALSALYLFTTAIHTSVLGALLTFSRGVWYPVYGSSALAWGLTPIADQQLAGLIMWIPGGVAYLIATLAIIRRWLDDSTWTGTATDAALALPR